MRWLSIDQKPSWFNNAGHTGTLAKKGGAQPSVKENFMHTRSRYSILTTVPRGWSMHDHVDNAPKIAILFKGAEDGMIRRSLSSSTYYELLPPTTSHNFPLYLLLTTTDRTELLCEF